MASAPARQLSQLLETFHAARTLTATELAGLSDLSREDAESVAGAFAGLPPTGSVEWRRTTSTTTAPPQEFATFDDFLAAVSDPADPALNARFVFATLIEFLNRFDADPNLVSMGNWNADEDDVLDTYLARTLALARPVRLRRGIDRLRISYAPGSADPRFDTVGIVYLRAG